MILLTYVYYLIYVGSICEIDVQMDEWIRPWNFHSIFIIVKEQRIFILSI